MSILKPGPEGHILRGKKQLQIIVLLAFLMGTAIGTVLGFLSKLPLRLQTTEKEFASFSECLLWSALPLLSMLFADERRRYLLPMLTFLRGCILSWSLMLVFRAGKADAYAMQFCSCFFSVPAFLLCADLTLTEPNTREKRNQTFLLAMLWFLTAATRWQISKII